MKISGVATTISSAMAIINHDDFKNSNHSTKWVEETLDLTDLEVGEDTIESTSDDVNLKRHDTIAEVDGRRFEVTFWTPDSTAKKPPRKSETNLTQREMDLSASIQKVTEEIIIKITRSLFKEYKISNLCLAGGVALNCVANGKILKDKTYKNVWVQPAAGDAGGALGAALGFWHIEKNNSRKVDQTKDTMRGSYLGPEYSENSIEDSLKKVGANYENFKEEEIIEKTSSALKDGKAIGWFQGRMEFGPRALGNRSIMADARSTTMQKNLNLKVKYRESFRPFAPSVIAEDFSEWFAIIPAPCS